jgi:hypothetical protein
MNFQKGFVILLSIAIFSIILTSYRNGPANRGHDKTGSPVSSGSCMNCHSSGSYSPTLLVGLYDGDTEVKNYEAGKQYTLKYQIVSTGSPSVYGFQSTALNSSEENAGSFDNIPDDFNLVTLKEVDYVEHSSPRPISSFEVNWTAPEEADDVITIYSAGIAANNNGNTGGDGADLNTLVLEPKTANTFAFEENAQPKLFELKSNIANNQLRLNIQSSLQSVQIYNMNGQPFFQMDLNNSDEGSISIPVADLPAGMYIVNCYGEGMQQTERFLKA